MLVGVVKIDLRANSREAWGTLSANEACPFENLAHSNSVQFQKMYVFGWNCAGKGEVEGIATFARTGKVDFVQNDAGYYVDNFIHLKTPLLDYEWRLQQGATATSGSMGTPPAGPVGGSASLSYQGAQIQVSMGSQPRPLSYSHSLGAPSISFLEGAACLTKYDRQIRSHSELSGSVDGSPLFPAQLAIKIHSSLVSSFHLLPCPENEQ